MSLPPLATHLPTDPLTALEACHVRIRTFTDGLSRMAALTTLDDPRVPTAAAQAHRYFAEGLPLHADDEDLSIGPRLRRAVPESAELLDDLERDHRAIDACLGTLLPLLRMLAEGKKVPHATFRAAVGFLREVLLPHIEREESALFPLLGRLSAEDRVAIAHELVQRRR